MKYLTCFLLFLILVSMVYSTKYNSRLLKEFLTNLKPGDSENAISHGLETINNTPDIHHTTLSNEDADYSTRFRFAEKKGRKAKEQGRLTYQAVTKLPTLFEGWLRVQGEYFVRNNELPALQLDLKDDKLIVDDSQNLINTAFQETKDTASLNLNKFFFYFRVNQNYLYLTPSKESSSIVFQLRTDLMKQIKNLNDEDNCLLVKSFPLGSKEKPEFRFCTPQRETVISLECFLTKASKKEDDIAKCANKLELNLNLNTPRIKKRQIKQPFIVIPSPQRMCNQGWNYINNGADWECLCKEGKMQSPIDLPSIKNAILTPIKPLFAYDFFNDKSKKLTIEHAENSLRIIANDDLLKVRGFGKLVTNDGSVYFATQIIFHTPSEHTFEGKKMPLEIQVLHEAKSKGDFGKKAILSFLYTGKPGIYNKFIDDIEFFNLPNPSDQMRYLHNKLYIPNALLSQDDGSTSVMKPFDFFTYQGSLTYPPCVENVIHYVVANPIPASITALDLFKEALRMPDFEDQSGNVITSKEIPLRNARDTQPLNGRAVFVYDSAIFNPPLFGAQDEDEKYNVKKAGHFEKQQQEVTDYMYVEGSELSNLPGAIVTSDEEAGVKPENISK